MSVFGLTIVCALLSVLSVAASVWNNALGNHKTAAFVAFAAGFSAAAVALEVAKCVAP